MTNNSVWKIFGFQHEAAVADRDRLKTKIERSLGQETASKIQLHIDVALGRLQSDDVPNSKITTMREFYELLAMELAVQEIASRIEAAAESKRVRQKCELRPAKRGKKLPRILTADHFRHFYQVVDQADDVQHSLLLRLLFFTGVRVSELCRIEVADVDLENCKIFISQGKGSKDRYVLFGRSFATALRTHIAAHPSNRWLFQTRRNTKYSTRRVQQIVKRYAERAGVKATPHTFRHQAITWLTRHSGLADAELQLITGHARRETLAIYQHVALDGELEERYQEAMKKADL